MAIINSLQAGVDLKLELGDFMLVVRCDLPSEVLAAVLIRDITYYRFEEVILVKAGTEIVVDTTELIALIGNDHVQIELCDYCLGLAD